MQKHHDRKENYCETFCKFYNFIKVHDVILSKCFVSFHMYSTKVIRSTVLKTFHIHPNVIEKNAVSGHLLDGLNYFRKKPIFLRKAVKQFCSPQAQLDLLDSSFPSIQC